MIKGRVLMLELEEVKKPVLEDISINMSSGNFLAVVGQVGCGKSSLLLSVMQETDLKKGKAFINGSIAYVEQEPFIMSNTVKNNIMFGLEFDQERMDEAINYSFLTEDLKVMNNGLETMIGERGVNVSGGQKARISLARAIYSNADIYLLDDPLSAVDP